MGGAGVARIPSFMRVAAAATGRRRRGGNTDFKNRAGTAT